MNKIFDWIGDLFSKVWKLIKKILPYVMIALATFFTFGGSLTLFGMVLEGYEAVIAAMGLSFLVAPGETIDVVSDVASDIGTAAGAIVSATVGGVASGLSSGDGSWLLIVAVVAGIYFLTSRKDETATVELIAPGNRREDYQTDKDPTVGTLKTAESSMGATL